MEFKEVVFSPLFIAIDILFGLSVAFIVKPLVLTYLGESFGEMRFLQINLGKGDKLTLETESYLDYYIKHSKALKVRLECVDVNWDMERSGELIAIGGMTKPGNPVITAVEPVYVEVWSRGKLFTAQRDYGSRYWIKQLTSAVIVGVLILTVWIFVGVIALAGWLFWTWLH